MALTLKVSQIDPDAYFQTPYHAHPGDPGFDLYVSQDYSIPPGGSLRVSHNLQIELPVGTWGMLVGRSSTFTTKHLQTQLGVLDNGYRGPVESMIYSVSSKPVKIRKGDRLSQLILLSLVVPEIEVVPVSELRPTDSASGGFGFTGGQ